MPRKNKWRDAHTGKRVVPSGHSLRMKKGPYWKEFRRSGEKPAMLSGVHPGQSDKEIVAFESSGKGSPIGHTYRKHYEKGRKHGSESWHSRQRVTPRERSFSDTHRKSDHEDIGPYSKNVSPITYTKAGGFTDKERKELPKTVTTYEPEAVKVRGESTRKKEYLKGPDIKGILKKRKKRRLAAQKVKVGLLEKRGL